MPALNYAVMPDFDPVDRMVYWTEVDDQTIKRAYLNGSGVEIVIQPGVTVPDHLAVDWVARNIYWTCRERKQIFVSRLNGSSRMALIKTGLDYPRGIAVDPGDG